MKEQNILVAIGLLKDWSNCLLVVQSGALGIIGAMVKDSRTTKARLLALVSVSFFVLSICAAANLIGSLPYLAQAADSIKDIYLEEGNLNIPIRHNATAQVILFILGLIAFLCFTWARTEGEKQGPES
jgi:hypothetical protein